MQKQRIKGTHLLLPWKFHKSRGFGTLPEDERHQQLSLRSNYRCSLIWEGLENYL